MKVSYKGFEIDAHRAESMGGDNMLYYSVYRESDGYECVCDFTSGCDTEEEYISYMKERIDAELLDDDPWGESKDFPLFEDEF